MNQVPSEQVQALARRDLDFSGEKWHCLPSVIRDIIAHPLTDGDRRRVFDYTTTHSEIARILAARPASNEMLELVYPDRNGEMSLTNPLDQALSRSISGQALRDRLEVCSKWLASNFVRPKKRVVDLGGGSGRYAFRAFDEKGHVPSRFTWVIMDLDPGALMIAATLAGSHRLIEVGAAVETQEANFLSEESVSDKKADYAVLIGVLCGMDKATAVAVLRRIKVHLKPGAELLAATLLQKAFDEDPNTFRILCNVGGWQLRPKTHGQVVKIFRSAGWKIIGDIMSERPGGNGQYAIVHARAL